MQDEDSAAISRRNFANQGPGSGTDERRAYYLALASTLILAAMPAIMVLSRNSPPLIAILIAILSCAAVGVLSRQREVVLRLQRFILSPGGALALFALLFMLASLAWTPVPERGALHVAHVAGSSLLIAVLLATAPMLRLWIGNGAPTVAMAVGLVVASLLTISHFKTGGAVNFALGVAAEDFRLNRAAIAIALLAPAVIAVLWRRQLAVALLLLPLGTYAIFLSHSSSAHLAALAMLASWPLAQLRPRAFHLLASIAIVASLLFAPLYVGKINSFIPQVVHEAVGYGSMGVRGEIWREYVGLWWHKPFFGYGMEAGNAIARTDYVLGLSEKQLHLLSFGHPHNAIVQIWFELGLAGALIAAGLLGLFLQGMRCLDDEALKVATLTTIGVYSVAAVSHGAWQAWWLCLVGLVAFSFLLQRKAISQTKRR